jgi:cell division protein ZapD
MIRFEYPLNEKSRVLLRLEHVFSRILHYLPSEEPRDTQVTIQHLIEATNFFSRADFKADLLKEIDRNLGLFRKLADRPNVDTERLEKTIEELANSQRILLTPGKQVGQELREGDFFKAIMQRSAVPGGSCVFDLPQLYLWLRLPYREREHTLHRWFEEFQPIHKTVNQLLTIYRGSYQMTEQVANNGNFQLSLDSAQFSQLVQVELDESLHIFPELSGNKHRFNIRFRHFDPESLGIDNKVADLSFQLGLSVI